MIVPPIGHRTRILLATSVVVGLLGVQALAGHERQAAQDGLHIVVVDGESGVNIIQQKTAVSPIVEVRDRNNSPVVGAAVTFAVKGGNAKALLGNGARQLIATTDAAGRATVAENPLASGSFQIQVDAAFGGQTASTTIAQTNVMNAADAAKAAAEGGAHTGLIIASAALAGAGVGGWKVYENHQDEKAEAAVNNACNIVIRTPQELYPAAGGTFTHTIEMDCNWTGTSDQPWITLISPTSGTKNSSNGTAILQPVTFTFSLQPNTSAQRDGHIVITQSGGGGGGTGFSIGQRGS